MLSNLLGNFKKEICILFYLFQWHLSKIEMTRRGFLRERRNWDNTFTVTCLFLSKIIHTFDLNGFDWHNKYYLRKQSLSTSWAYYPYLSVGTVVTLC